MSSSSSSITPQQLTHEYRTSIFKRFDKLTYHQRNLVLHKHLGAMSVVLSQETKYWQELENYIKEYEDMQTVLPYSFTGNTEEIIDKHLDKKLDKPSDI
jgi:hypothetical protein